MHASCRVLGVEARGVGYAPTHSQSPSKAVTWPHLRTYASWTFSILKCVENSYHVLLSEPLLVDHPLVWTSAWPIWEQRNWKNECPKGWRRRYGRLYQEWMMSIDWVVLYCVFCYLNCCIALWRCLFASFPNVAGSCHCRRWRRVPDCIKLL